MSLYNMILNGGSNNNYNRNQDKKKVINKKVDKLEKIIVKNKTKKNKKITLVEDKTPNNEVRNLKNKILNTNPPPKNEPMDMEYDRDRDEKPEPMDMEYNIDDEKKLKNKKKVKNKKNGIQTGQYDPINNYQGNVEIDDLNFRIHKINLNHDELNNKYHTASSKLQYEEHKRKEVETYSKNQNHLLIGLNKELEKARNNEDLSIYEKKKEIDKLNNEINDIHINNNKKTQLLKNEHNNQINLLNKDIDSHKSNIDKIKSDNELTVKQKDKQIKKNNDQIQNLSGKIKIIENENKNKITKYEKTLNKQNDKLINNDNKVNDNDNKISKYEKTLNKQNDKLINNNSKIIDLNNQVDDIKKMKTEINNSNYTEKEKGFKIKLLEKDLKLIKDELEVSNKQNTKQKHENIEEIGKINIIFNKALEKIKNEKENYENKYKYLKYSKKNESEFFKELKKLNEQANKITIEHDEKIAKVDSLFSQYTAGLRPEWREDKAILTNNKKLRMRSNDDKKLKIISKLQNEHKSPDKMIKEKNNDPIEEEVITINNKQVFLSKMRKDDLIDIINKYKLDIDTKQDKKSIYKLVKSQKKNNPGIFV